MTTSSRGRSLHLLVPGLLDVPDAWFKDFGTPPVCHTLYRLIARARIIPDATDFEWALADCFGLEPDGGRDLPYGSITRQASCGDADDGIWACAEPIHLQAGISDVIPLAGAGLGLDADEAGALSARFNDHFADRGLTLWPTHRDRWHLRLATDPGVRTLPLSRIVGRPLREHLPRGTGAAGWHAVLTEIQMLLHDSPTNRARIDQNLPAINGLWVWGIGVLCPLHSRFSLVAAGPDGLAADIAAVAGTAVVGEAADEILDSQGEWPRLLVVDSLVSHVAADDYEGWCAVLDRLEKEVFRPLESALLRGKLDELVIRPCDSRKRYLIRGGAWGALAALCKRVMGASADPWDKARPRS